MDARLPAPLIGVARMLLAGTGFFLSVISALLNAILGHVSPMQLPVPPPALPKTLRRRQRQSQTALTPRSPTSKSGSSGSSTVLVTPPDAADSDVQVASAGSSRLSAPSPSSPSKIPLSSKILVRRRRKGPCSPKALEPSRSAPSTPLEELPSAFELTPPTPPSRATTLAPAHGASLSPFDSDECLVVEVQQTRSFTMNIRRALGGEKGAQKPAFARTISTPQVPRAATIVGPPAPIPRRKSCPDNKKEALSRSMTMSPESPSEQAALDSPTAERRNKSPFGGRKPQQRKRTLPYEAPYFAQTPVPPLPRSKPAASSDSDRRPRTADASATA
ncbi:hypothetical protein HDZ31DRAFT_47459 [Schizophyllum fasciatum]